MSLSKVTDAMIGTPGRCLCCGTPCVGEWCSACGWADCDVRRGIKRCKAKAAEPPPVDDEEGDECDEDDALDSADDAAAPGEPAHVSAPPAPPIVAVVAPEGAYMPRPSVEFHPCPFFGCGVPVGGRFRWCGAHNTASKRRVAERRAMGPGGNLRSVA